MQTAGSAPNVTIDQTPGTCGESGTPYDPTAAEMELLPGGLQVVIRKPRSITSATPAAPSRLSYVVEYEVSFGSSGSASFWSTLRAGQSKAIALNLISGNGFLELVQFDSTTGLTTDLITPIPIANILSGRTIKLGAAVGQDSYVIFVDGKKVAEYSDPQVTGPFRPHIAGVNCFDNSSTGSFLLQGLRVIQYAGQ